MTKNSNSDFCTFKLQSQVLGSVDPLLDISEPPDIKNWISSYKYESPELNTGECLDLCNNLTVNDSEEDVSYVEDSIKEKDEDLGVFLEIKNGDDFRACDEIEGSGFDEGETYVEDSFKEKKENFGVLWELKNGDDFRGCGEIEESDFNEEETYVEDTFKEKKKNLGVIGELRNGVDFRGCGEIEESDSDEEETYVEDTFKEKRKNLGVIGESKQVDELENCGGLKGSESNEDMSFVEDSIDEKYEDLGVFGDTDITDFRSSDGSKGDDCEEDGSYVEGIIRQKDQNLGMLQKHREESENIDHDKVASKAFVRCDNFVANNDANKVEDMSDTVGFSSEPPDIKNWFSSYVYESPALDTSDEFGLSSYEWVHIGMSIKSREEHAIKNAITGKRNCLLSKTRASAEFIQTSSSAKVNNDDHHIQGISEAVGEKGSSVITDLPLNSEETDTSILSDRDSNRKPKRKFPHNDSCAQADINVSSVDEENSPRKLLSRSKHTEEGSEGKPPDSAIVTVSPRSNSHFTAIRRSSSRRTDTSNNKENGKNDYAENGFISARKNRSRNENDKNLGTTRLGAHPVNNIQVSAGSNKVEHIRRRALTDTTNTQLSDVLGVAGKWRCPQKSKPNLGPPMKQLRLERWVHRI